MGGFLFNSLTPLYHFYLLHRHLGIGQEITTVSSPPHIASNWTWTESLWFPSASYWPLSYVPHRFSLNKIFCSWVQWRATHLTEELITWLEVQLKPSSFNLWINCSILRQRNMLPHLNILGLNYQMSQAFCYYASFRTQCSAKPERCQWSQ